MQSIRIEPTIKDGLLVLLVDVVCDCGRNNLRRVVDGKASVKHAIPMGTYWERRGTPGGDGYVEGLGEMRLFCDSCKKHYCIVNQKNHIHVFTHKEE